jgi:hypothetical protein
MVKARKKSSSEIKKKKRRPTNLMRVMKEYLKMLEMKLSRTKPILQSLLLPKNFLNSQLQAAILAWITQ